MWKKVNVNDGACTFVQGDKNAPPTRWWNHWWLVLFGWKTIVTFRVPEEVAKAGYYVGYWAFKGPAMCKNERLHDEIFSMKIGHENCRFFIEIMHGGFKSFKSPQLITRGPLH